LHRGPSGRLGRRPQLARPLGLVMGGVPLRRGPSGLRAGVLERLRELRRAHRRRRRVRVVRQPRELALELADLPAEQPALVVVLGARAIELAEVETHEPTQ